MTRERRRPTSEYAYHAPEAPRAALLALYGADAEVERALVELHDRHYLDRQWPHELEYVRIEARRAETGAWIYPQGSRAEALLTDLEAVAERFGLLHAFGKEYACERLHEWCLLRRQMGPAIGGPELVMAGGHSYMVPLDEREVAVTWRPDLEPRRAAEERAGAAVAAALDRIRDDWEAAGWQFKDTTPKAPEHLRWLFLRLRHGWSYAEIARRVGIADDPDYFDPPKAIAKAVKEMAKKAGVCLPDGNS